MSGSTLYILYIECYIYVVSFDFGWINSFPVIILENQEYQVI